MTTAIIICSYNMPERTDALVEHIRAYINHPHTLTVFDNGSDLVEPSKYTTHRIEKNIQMVPGFMKALELALEDSAAEYYWLITTSAAFISDDVRDPLELMIPMLSKATTYAVHPAAMIDYGAWKQHMAPLTNGWRRVHSFENIAPLYKAEHFDALGRWNEKLSFGWGVSAETFYNARSAGLNSFIYDDYVIEKKTFVGYHMKRMNMTGEQRSRLATEQADAVLGENWREQLNKGLAEEFRKSNRLYMNKFGK